MNGWKCRPPPEGETTFQMCKKQNNCWYGDSCIHAHSEMELNKWYRQKRARQNERARQVNGEETLAMQLLRELKKAKAEKRLENTVIVEVGSGYSVRCSEKLYIPHIPRGREVTWQFTITSSIPSNAWFQLKNIYTLDPFLPEFSLTNIKIGESAEESFPPGTQVWSTISHAPATKIEVTVKFLSSSFGHFNQRLIFDFGEIPKIVRDLGVKVAPEETLVKSLQYRPVCTEDSELAWLQRYPFVPFESGDTSWSDKETRAYPLPPNMANAVYYGSFDHLDAALIPDNYRERLHTLLFIEEYERRRQLTRLNLHCDDIFEVLKRSVENPTLRTMVLPIQEQMMDDASLLIKRSSRALVRVHHPSSSHHTSKEGLLLFESVVEDLKRDCVVLQVSAALQTALGSLAGQAAVPADVCFRFVDTYQLMHKAVDTVALDLVFPSHTTAEKTSVWPHPPHKVLNGAQTAAMKEMVDPLSKPPVLILGPFGTGKTRTIAEAVKELIQRSGDYRILICTHSNSAADHYIDDYLHPIFSMPNMAKSPFRPLRICWQHRFSSAMSENVLRYCLIDQKTGKFSIPTMKQIHSRRIVVTTLVTADELVASRLPPGYFTHIFIDEAAQAMEAESVIPLCLANQNTKIVMAGDHLQLSPPVLSVIAQKLQLNRSLLVRLHEYYPVHSSCKVHLIENYRSYKEIVDIPSKLFYGDTLLSHLTRPPGVGYPIHFHGVLGREEWSKDQPSYYNMVEVAETVEQVKKLADNWPEAWGEMRQSNICVLAPYIAQIKQLRKYLRYERLGGVRVESVNGVQGLEFDALFISTVRTYNTMTAETMDRSDFGFLSDPKLLNTAVTRAKYHLCVIGDPNALCGVGLSKVCWKTILAKCDENGTYNYRLPFSTIIKIIRGTIDTPLTAPTNEETLPQRDAGPDSLMSGGHAQSTRIVIPASASQSILGFKTPQPSWPFRSIAGFHSSPFSSTSQQAQMLESSQSGLPGQVHGFQSLFPGWPSQPMSKFQPSQINWPSQPIQRFQPSQPGSQSPPIQRFQPSQPGSQSPPIQRFQFSQAGSQSSPIQSFQTSQPGSQSPPIQRFQLSQPNSQSPPIQQFQPTLLGSQSPPIQRFQPSQPNSQSLPLKQFQPTLLGSQSPPIQRFQPSQPNSQSPPIQQFQPTLLGSQSSPIQSFQHSQPGSQSPPIQSFQPSQPGSQSPPIQSFQFSQPNSQFPPIQIFQPPQPPPIQRFQSSHRDPQLGDQNDSLRSRCPFPGSVGNFYPLSIGQALPQFPLGVRLGVLQQEAFCTHPYFKRNPNFQLMQMNRPAGPLPQFNPPFFNNVQRLDLMSRGWEINPGQGENIISSDTFSQRIISPNHNGPLQQHQAASPGSSKLDQEVNSSYSLTSNLKNQEQHQKIICDGNNSSSTTSLQFLIKLKNSLQKRNDDLSSECSEISLFLDKNRPDSIVLPPEAISKLERSLSLLKEEARLVERRHHLIQHAELDTEGMIRELNHATGTPSRQEKDNNTDILTQRDQRSTCSPVRSGRKNENSGDSPSSVLNCTSESLLDISEDDELLNFDNDEWFEARRKDPIVQDYIRTFELLMSQPQAACSIVSEKEVWHLPQQQQPEESVLREDDFPALGAAANTISEHALLPGPLGQWVLQPTATSVYVEQQPIHEEYLREDVAEILIEKRDLIKCTLQVDAKSGGKTAVAKVYDPSLSDVYIGNRGDMNRAFHGDVVAVKLKGTHQDPVLKGKVVSIMAEVHHRDVVCRPDLVDRNIMVPINKTNPRFIILQSKDHRGETGVAIFGMGSQGEMQFQQFVTETVGKLFVVRLMKWGANYRYPLGFVMKCVKEGTECRSALSILLAESGIRPRQPKQMLAEMKRLYPKAWQIPEEERKHRPVYRDAITLDPEGSMELDDAITLRRESGTYLVGVHVADVSYFVVKDSAADKSASARGMSVHPDPALAATFPMFPSELSSKLCSLVAGKERLAVTVMFSLDEEGNMTKPPDIHRSIVCSGCQMSYEQCAKILGGDSNGDVEENVRETLTVLSQLTSRMAAKRVRTGSLVRMELSYTNERRAYSIVEELMLQANIAVAGRLLACDGTRAIAPLRRQLPPKDASLSDLRKWCALHGFSTAHSFTLNRIYSAYPPQDYPAYLDVADWERISMALDTKDVLRLTQAMVRQNQQPEINTALAQLNTIQERGEYVIAADTRQGYCGHFSLAVDCYTHFTSPLRRYFDLVVHRMLIAALNRTSAPYSADELRTVCLQSNAQAIRIESFEKQSAGVSVAAALGAGKSWKTATVDLASANSLEFSSRKLQGFTLSQRGLRVHNLKASSRDWLREEQQLMLKWHVLETDYGKSDVTTNDVDHQLLLDSSPPSAALDGGVARSQLQIPNRLWTAFVNAFVCEDYQKLNEFRAKINQESVLKLKDTSMETSRESVISSISLSNSVQPKWVYTHFYRKHDQATLLIGSEVHRGFLQPVIDGLHLGHSLICCIRHQRKAADCFGQPLCERTKDTYSDVKDYQTVMEPLLVNESAINSTGAETCHVVVKGLRLSWMQDANKGNIGQFAVAKTFCSTHSIQFAVGDFMCIRYSTSPSKDTSNGDQVTSHEPGQVTQDTEDPQVTVRVLHCRVIDVSGLGNNRSHYDVQVHLVEPKDGLSPDILAAGAEMACTIQLIPQWLPYRRMINAVQRLHTASELVRNVILRRNVPEYLARRMSLTHSPKVQILPGLRLDTGQQEALKQAVTSPLTLIQGPPGTGKTWTAVAVARQFIAMNTENSKAKGGHVLYCGPSNQSVDVAARMLRGVPGIKMLRVYGRTIESQSFAPISQMGLFLLTVQQASMDESFEDIALHHRVRGGNNPHSAALLQLEKEIIHLRNCQDSGNKLSEKVHQYREVLDKAERFEIANNGVNLILCTCTEAASSRLRKHSSVVQCIIDECSMCTEPECLVPMIAAGQQCRHTVLVGDHKQLAPIVMSPLARKLGLARSLFGTLFESRSKKAYSSYMLHTQYRMHPSIRKFPSKHFYHDKLQDASEVTRPERMTVGNIAKLWPAGQDVRLVFCHVQGEEESPQDFTGSEGREDSKFNELEVNKTVDIVRYVLSCGIAGSRISVFTPYTAQKIKIAKALQQNLGHCSVETLSVFASQGSECDFVIISTVRSLPENEVLVGPSQQWMALHLGFLSDEHQINVAITRARHGLFIVGNKHLLAVHPMWNSLLEHYAQQRCIVDGKEWPAS